MNNINLTSLHPYLRTKKNANKLISILEKLADGLFKEGFDVSGTLSKEVSSELKERLKKIATEAGISMEDKKPLESFLKQLETEISTLPLIHIMLSDAPKDEIIGTIQDWFYQNFKKKCAFGFYN